MAANNQQGQGFGLFLVGITIACAGIYGFSSGIGKVALAVGLVLLVVSLLKFFKLKSLEGKAAAGAQLEGMKALGLLMTVGGWIVVLFGLHIASGVAGRLIIALIGLGISLVGVIGILPAACNKNAIWKA